MGPRYVPHGPHDVKKTRPDGGFRQDQRSRFFGFPDEDFLEEPRFGVLFLDEDRLDFDLMLFDEDFELDFLTLPFDFPDFDDRDLAPDFDDDDCEDRDLASDLEAPFERDVALDFEVARDLEEDDREVARDFDPEDLEVALDFEAPELEPDRDVTSRRLREVLPDPTFLPPGEEPRPACVERERSLLIPRISRFTTGSRFSTRGGRFITRVSPGDLASGSFGPRMTGSRCWRTAGRLIRSPVDPTLRLRPDSRRVVVVRRMVRALSRSSLWNGTLRPEGPTIGNGARDSRTL